MDSDKSPKNLVHDFFAAGLLLKGLDGIMEIFGGVAAIFLDPVRLNKIILALTRHELSEDPRDFIAVNLVKLAGQYSIGTQIFDAAYLLSHGLIKIFLIASIWLKKLWAYPLYIAVFSLFTVYQLYRYAFTHSLFLIILSVFDIAIIILAWLEYRRLKS